MIGVSGRTGVGEKKIEAMEEQGPQSKERQDKDSRIFLFWLQMQRNTMQSQSNASRLQATKICDARKGFDSIWLQRPAKKKKDVQLLLTRNKKGSTAFLIAWPIEGFGDNWNEKEQHFISEGRIERRKREEEIKWANSFDTETHRAFDEQLNFRVIITIDVVNKTTEKGCNAVFE